MPLQKLQEFLNSHKIKYITINHSPVYTKQELANYKRAWGMKLIEAVLVEIETRKIAMAVMPASVQINLESLREALGTTAVRLIDRREIENLFPGCEFGTVPPFGNLYNMDVFLAANLSQNQDVAFYVGSYAHLIQMKYKDFEKLANFEKRIAFLTRPRYRALLRAVYPKSARQELKNYESCILGLSLESENFSTSKLVAITDWISKHFKKCTVMIGDSLHRITLQTDRGLPENKALNKALLIGREYIDRESLVFERHADTCPFDIVLSSEIQKRDDYVEYYEKIQHLLVQDRQKLRILQVNIYRIFLHSDRNLQNSD